MKDSSPSLPTSHLTSMKFRELSNSNVEPHDFQADEIRHRIAEIDDVYKVIPPETTQWTDFSHLLLERRRVYSAILSPIRRVPPEIWAEVFQYELADMFVFSVVCRMWRHAALSSPRLWNIVMIDLEDTFHNDLDLKGPEFDFITTWIGRSKAIPISMCLFYEANKFMKEEQAAKIMDVIPGKERWKSLYVGPRCLKPLFHSSSKSVSQTQWDMLQELAIVSSTTFYDPILPYNSTSKGPVSLLALRSLRKLTVKVPDCVSVDYLIAPWAQLVYLHMDGTCSRLADYIGILGECTNLEECLIYIQDVYHPSPSTSIPTKRIGLHKLRSLLVSGTDNVSPILRYLHLPALEDLYLSARCSRFSGWPLSMGDTPRSPGRVLAELIRFSGCALRTLELHTISMKKEDVMTCFRALNTLEQLKVTNVGYLPPLDDALLREIVCSGLLKETPAESVEEEKEVGAGVKALDSVLLPKLASLEVHSYHHGTLSSNAFEDLIRARRPPPGSSSQIPGVARLHHARLTNHWDSPLDLFMRMARSSAFERLSPFIRSLSEYGVGVGIL
ncbi:hypothetical protein M413DRAFT_447649 [Hebeloma cylindrosporum]|uniref:F-box domain-containing protein n=1 Tax=Hebeloma cylindrosporum TaxID=76867 RepID=A0A0C3C535_HEBCY|nr:hypothetical protein M413DRAFT_447649 [Hebeloma cylindrosporum h7]